ncbi:MAG: acyl-CoA thioesterase [Alphaproteobacteria bacterium]|nr:acyl-CoA thioesterase [Alphaproteobacteria bacterium]
MGQFVETHRGMVQAWECDHLGHMNVQFYIARCSDAAWHLMHHVGLSPSFARAERIGLAAVRYDAEFRRELRAGDLLRMDTAVLAIGRSSIRLLNRLWNAGTDEIAMLMRNDGVCLDLETRRARPLPDFVRTRAEALLVSEEEARA